jgi:hypothetical protein
VKRITILVCIFLMLATGIGLFSCRNGSGPPLVTISNYTNDSSGNLRATLFITNACHRDYIMAFGTEVRSNETWQRLSRNERGGIGQVFTLMQYTAQSFSVPIETGVVSRFWFTHNGGNTAVGRTVERSVRWPLVKMGMKFRSKGDESFVSAEINK